VAPEKTCKVLHYTEVRVVLLMTAHGTSPAVSFVNEKVLLRLDRIRTKDYFKGGRLIEPGNFGLKAIWARWAHILISVGWWKLLRSSHQSFFSYATKC
jgi:hypothetical protein